MGEIREGQKVKIYLMTMEDSEKEFDCSIKDVYTDRLVLNFPPEILAYSEQLEEGSEIPVRIFTPLGVKVFDTMVLNSPQESEFTIEYVQNSTDIQRREYVRVQCNMKVVIEQGGYNNNIVTYTIDIGGGGIRFFYEGSFAPQESVKITLFMPEDRSIQARGTVIENNFIPANHHVLSFTEIEEKERDRLIKKCFEIQLAK